jgi:hypothetical protein
MRFIVCFLIFFCALNVQGQCQGSNFYIEDVFYLKVNPILEGFNWCIYNSETVDSNIIIESKNKHKYVLDSLINDDPKNPILYAYKICNCLDSNSKFYVDELDSIYSKFPTNSFINYSIFLVLPDELYDKRNFHLQEAIKYNTDSTQLSKLIMKDFYLDTIRDFHSQYNICQKALSYDLSNVSAYSMLADIHYKIDCFNDAKKYDSLEFLYRTIKEISNLLKNSFCNDEFSLFGFYGYSSYMYEISKFFSTHFKTIKTLKISNPSYLFYNMEALRSRDYCKIDSVFFNHFNIPFGFKELNFNILDSLSTLFLIAGEVDFIPEIPRSILNLKSLKKIELTLFIPKSEIEFIKKNYPNIELVYDDVFVDEKIGLNTRNSFYEALKKAGGFK